MMRERDKPQVQNARLKNICSDQSGNVAVITALCLTVILSVLAFVLNTGLLYAEKNRYQNAVEAAAMAGAVSLCDEDPEGTAINILLKNLFPDGYEGEELPEGYTVDVVPGYYDESGLYDFSDYSEFGYSSFIDETNLPEGFFVNSVLVRLTVDQKLIMANFLETDDVSLQTTAAAYLKSYGILSLGEESDDGITFTNFFGSEPLITGGTIHANNNISFGASPTIDSSSVMVTAAGNISGYGGGTSGVDPISLKTVAAYLEDLYARADKIITEDDFPAVSGGEYTDEYGNVYTRRSGLPIFKPHVGDHGGMVYYFAGDGDVQLGNISDEGDVTNLMFVSETSVMWFSGSENLAWGGENEHQVTIIAGEDICFAGTPPTPRSDDSFVSKGVVLLAGDDIYWNNGGTVTFIRNLRMIAEGSIEIDGPGDYHPSGIAYNLNFGPPCPPHDVRLGRPVTP